MKRLANAAGIGYYKGLKSRERHAATDREVETAKSDGHKAKRPKRSG